MIDLRVFSELEAGDLAAIGRLMASMEDPLCRVTVYHYAYGEHPLVTAEKRRVFSLLFPRVNLENVKSFVAPETRYRVLIMSPVSQGVVDEFKRHSPGHMVIYAGDNTIMSHFSFANWLLECHLTPELVCPSLEYAGMFYYDVFGRHEEMVKELQIMSAASHLDDSLSRDPETDTAREVTDIPGDYGTLSHNVRMFKYLFDKHPGVLFDRVGYRADLLSQFQVVPAAGAVTGDYLGSMYGVLYLGRRWDVYEGDEGKLAWQTNYSSYDLGKTRDMIRGYFAHA